MHDLSTETFISRYTLRGALRLPLAPAVLGAMSMAGTAISAVGTLAAGGAAAAAGEAQKNAAYYQAQQQELAAKEAMASGQRSMFEKQREATYIQSKLQSRAAASGGSASDAGTINLAGNVAQRGEYEALAEMYKGENRARGLEDAAIASRMTGDALAEGEARRTASYLSAGGSLLQGAANAYQIYRYPELRSASGKLPPGY